MKTRNLKESKHVAEVHKFTRHQYHDIGDKIREIKQQKDTNTAQFCCELIGISVNRSHLMQRARKHHWPRTCVKVPNEKRLRPPQHQSSSLYAHQNTEKRKFRRIRSRFLQSRQKIQHTSKRKIKENFILFRTNALGFSDNKSNKN